MRDPGRDRDRQAGVDVVARHRRLAELELTLVSQMMRERYLADALEPLVDSYDVCVLDCPPNLGLLTVNALVAADRVLVPVRMENEGALQGVIELRGTLAKLASRGLKRQIDGVLRTVVDHRRTVYDVLDAGLANEHLDPLDAEIPARAAFHRQGVEGAPIVISQPDSLGASTSRSPPPNSTTSSRPQHEPAQAPKTRRPARDHHSHTNRREKRDGGEHTCRDNAQAPASGASTGAPHQSNCTVHIVRAGPADLRSRPARPDWMAHLRKPPG